MQPSVMARQTGHVVHQPSDGMTRSTTALQKNQSPTLTPCTSIALPLASAYTHT